MSSDAARLMGLPVGWRIAALRQERGWSQKVLADTVGVSKSYVEKIEEGRRQLDRVTMRLLFARALGVDEELLGHQTTVERYPAARCARCEGTYTNPRLQHPGACGGRLVQVIVTITLAESDPAAMATRSRVAPRQRRRPGHV